MVEAVEEEANEEGGVTLLEKETKKVETRIKLRDEEKGKRVAEAVE